METMKKVPTTECENPIDYNNIIPLNAEDTSISKEKMQEDFYNSGIKDTTLKPYIDGGYIDCDKNGWTIYFPELDKNEPSEYYARKIYNPKDNQGKYIKTPNEPARIFRPLQLSPEIYNNKDEYIMVVEGEKKALKGAQEGFNTVSLGGVWSWKKTIKKDENINDSDIISDIANADFEDKEIYLCYDNDFWQKEQVKQALYQFAAYLLSEKKAIVKIIKLPHSNIKLGLDDFLMKYGNVALRSLMKETQPIKLKEIQTILSGNIANTKSFPIDIFNERLKNLLIELHLRHDAPLEYIGSLFIAFISVVMLGKYRILVDKTCDWTDDPIIWLAVVGNPSQKKTPALNIFKKITDAFEQELNNKYETEVEEYKKQVQEYKRQLKYFEAGKIAELPEDPKEPLKQRLTTQNTTVEALLRAVSKNEKGFNRGISIVVDELTNLLKSFGQYKGGNGNDLEYFIQAWKAQLTNTLRQGTNIDYTTCVYHSIIGTIQPSALDKTLLNDGIETTNGMKERWLLATSKYEETGEKYCGDNEYNIELIKNIFERLYRYNGEPKLYNFSYDAQKVFDEFCKKITYQKKSPKLSDLMKNYLQKQTDYVARFSLILHCIENSNNLEINSKTVVNAINLSHYFISCFEDIILQRFNTIPLSDHALNYILTRGLKKISPTNLYKSNTSKFKSKDNALIALEHLANRGYGRLVKTSSGGVSFIVYS